MMNRRNRACIAVAALAFYALLAAGSMGTPVPPTIRLIIQHRQLLISLATQTMKASTETSQSIDTAFEDLRVRLSAASLATETIEGMEAKNAELKQRAAVLQQSLNNTEQAARQWFDMLEVRARQNQTPELRKDMLNDINTSQRAFNERTRTAQAAVQQINSSVQKYDDIVGYVQVKAGLAGIDQQLVRIDAIITEANALDREIQTAIAAGLRVIDELNVPAEG